MRRFDLRSRDDSGAILFIVLLMLLALTGIGLVAMQSASNNLNLTGNSRVAQVARNIASSGAEGTMAFAGLNPSAFTQFVAANLDPVDGKGLVAMGDLSNNFFDSSTDGSGSFGWDGVTVNTARWSSKMVTALTTPRAPGFQIGEYCFRRYTSETDGMYRNDLPTGTANAQSLTVDRNAQARSMATMFVGPVACP